VIEREAKALMTGLRSQKPSMMPEAGTCMQVKSRTHGFGTWRVLYVAKSRFVSFGFKRSQQINQMGFMIVGCATLILSLQLSLPGERCLMRIYGELELV